MRSNIARVQSVFLFLIEWLLGYTIFLPFYKTTWQLIIPAVIVSLIIVILNYFISKLLKQKASLAIYFIVILLIAVIGGFVWFPMPFSIFFTGFMGWRLLFVLNRRTLNHSWGIFFVTTFVSIFYYFVITLNQMSLHFSHPPYLLVLIIIQLLFVLIANVFSQVEDAKYQSSFMIVTYLILLLSAILLGGLLYFIVPVLRILLIGIFGALGYIFVMMFQLIFSRIHSNGSTLQKLKHFENSQSANKTLSAAQPKPHQLDSLIWIIPLIIVAAVVCIIIIIKLRKRHLNFDAPEKKVRQGQSVSLDTSPFSSLIRKKRKPPKDQIRLLLYQFQKKMKKLGYGRYTKETLDEWLKRLHMSQKDSIRSLYEKVRYGGVPLTDQEFTQYQQLITEATQEMTKRKEKEDEKD